MSSESILVTGKDGYVADSDFDERTEKALRGDERLLFRDALDVESFATDDFRTVAPILARLRRYRLLDLGCGYGRLAPLLAAFDCAGYLGIDRVGARLDYARRRYGSGLFRFELADVLGFRADRRFDVVWTSTVLQHFLIPDKLRLVETMKLLHAPGGVILMREEEIVDCTRAEAERRYASPAHARHMVPITFDELATAFRPLALRHLGGMVYAAGEC